jgi:hypothetical protein
MSERSYPYTIEFSGFDRTGYGRLNLSFDWWTKIHVCK